MATIYVRSTDGDNADDGSTWALAKATIAGAAAIDAAGDRIYLSQSHSESTAGAVSPALAGTFASPTLVICGNDAAEPPTATASTGAIATTGANSLTWSGASYYISGLVMTAGDSTNNASVVCSSTNGALVVFKDCDFILGNSSANGRISIGTAATYTVRWRNCDVKFGASGQAIIQTTSGEFFWNGGSILSGGTSPGSLFKNAASSTAICRAMISNVDLSNGGSGMHLVDAGATPLNYVFRNCKLPGSWTGSLLNGTISTAQRCELHNCDSGDTNYRIWIDDYTGSLKSETALVRSGGSSDGTTQLSWKIVTTANAEYPSLPFVSAERVIWNDTTGGSKTATVSIIHAETALLTDKEVAIRVFQLGTSGFPLGTLHDDEAADTLGAAADQATDTGSDWDDLITARGNLTLYAAGDKVKVASNPSRVFQCTTGGTTGASEAAGFATAVDGDAVTDTTAVFRTMWRQKVNVSFTPQEKGFIHWTVVVFKASATVFVDPKVIIT